MVFKVHQELSQQTLHLTVELVDRFLTYQRIPLNTFQLVGITCLLIAAKYHERFAPEVGIAWSLQDYGISFELNYCFNDFIAFRKHLREIMQGSCNL